MLFIILIAVALFAALSYAVTRGSRGSQSVPTEEARMMALEMVQYGDSLRPIVDRMLLVGGISDTNTSSNGILFDAPGSGTAPLTRELFDPSGGNVPLMTPPPQACNSTCAYVFSGQYTLTGVGTGANPDLAMLLVDVPQTVCKMINVVLNLGTTIPTGTTLSASPAGGVLTTVTAFTGTNYGAATAITLTTSNHAFCYQEVGGTNRYIYVNVIRAR